MSTETVDQRFVEVDRWSTEAAVEAMLEGQLSAVAAIKSQVRVIADAANAAAVRLKRGGRLVYAGAGTSGRIAVQDGVELTPTYNWPSERLVFLMAGGPSALTESAEGAEDDIGAGKRDVVEAHVTEADVLIGVAASGRTPYTLAAIGQARALGALTIGVANNAGAPLLLAAEYAVLLDTGSEIVAGSTRMKAGTAQKAVLNMLSTAMMIRCGLVHRGLMVNMRVSNDKLRLRAQAMIEDIAGVDPAQAERALAQADLEIKRGVMIALGAPRDQADAWLANCDADLRLAIASFQARVDADA